MKTGHFENVAGYRICQDVELSSAWKAVYRFSLNRVRPLTFVDGNAIRWQPNRSFSTDQGSVPRFPPCVRCVVPKDRFLGFYLHDSGYMNGGLYADGEFKPMSRKQVDDLLYEMILGDPIAGSRATAWLIWSHVRMYGWAAGWKKGDRAK